MTTIITQSTIAAWMQTRQVSSQNEGQVKHGNGITELVDVSGGRLSKILLFVPSPYARNANTPKNVVRTATTVNPMYMIVGNCSFFFIVL